MSNDRADMSDNRNSNNNKDPHYLEKAAWVAAIISATAATIYYLVYAAIPFFN